MEIPTGIVKTKVTMGMKVIRVDGSTEDYGEQFSKVVELDYPMAVRMLGQEQADALFSVGKKGLSDDDS